jgi:hypothetical protein
MTPFHARYLCFRNVVVDSRFIPRCHTICKFSTPLVHLLLWLTYIAILSFHSTMNFNRFYTFTCQKSNNRTLFSFGACLKWGGHFTCYHDDACSSELFCHLLDISYTTSNNIAILQDSGIKFRIFITKLPFQFH